MTPGERAEQLISDLGISEPSDLDVDAIAFDSGVSVVYDNLRDCDATLVGIGDRAIATIKPSIRGRERFSVAHELGHWSEHRGQSFTCRVEDVDANLMGNQRLEREADQYAAHLLLPSELLKPQIRSLKIPSFNQVTALAKLFDTSILATCFRLTGLNAFPVVLAAYNDQGCRWHARSKDVPSRWWLKGQLDEDSFAHDLLTRGITRKGPGKQSADVWFDNDDAGNYEIFEECMPGRVGEILVLLSIDNEEMLEASFDRDLWTGRRGR
jgi:Zn-dependent peptidase ImmA (M78 family)